MSQTSPKGDGWPLSAASRCLFFIGITLAILFTFADPVFAHAVADGDKGYIQEVYGVLLIPFTYLGAKHMMTGYDHILFCSG